MSKKSKCNIVGWVRRAESKDPSLPYTPSPVHLSGPDMRFLFKQRAVMGRVWSHPSLTHHYLRLWSLLQGSLTFVRLCEISCRETNSHKPFPSPSMRLLEKSYFLGSALSVVWKLKRKCKCFSCIFIPARPILQQHQDSYLFERLHP